MPSDVIQPGEPDPVPSAASTPVKTADDVARLLAERMAPGGRGFLVWMWILAIPLLWVSLIMALETGDWPWPWALLAGILTGRTLVRKAWFASVSRTALLLPELDRDWLGPLIDALTYPKAAVRDVARLRLTTVLPTLGEFDPESLTPGRRALLFDHLTPWKAYCDPDFVGAILRFGAASGDERALLGSERLARMRAFNGAQRRTRTLARQTLPQLESRVYEQTLKIGADSGKSTSRSPAVQSKDHQLSSEARSWLADAEGDSRRQPGMRFGFLLGSWGVIVPYMLYQTVNQWREGQIPVALLFLLCGILATQLYRFALTPQQLRLAGKLGGVDNVEAVGSLTELTDWPDERIRSMAIAALTRILPRMRSSDSHLLSGEHRKCLYSWLDLRNADKHAEFQEALLKALEQVGDVNALENVSALAAKRPSSIRERRVVDAANLCLPFLKACADSNRNSQILLRPITDDSVDARLLRPARQTEISPELLVRVAVPSDP